jgi:hypothetical protein
METKVSLPSPDDQKKLTTYLAEQAKISNHIAQPISLPLTDEAKARLAQIDATDRDNQRAELTNLKYPPEQPHLSNQQKLFTAEVVNLNEQIFIKKLGE